MVPSAVSRDRLLAPARHVFVSPHYDDIALSCGGTVALLTRADREASIRVVFGATPAPPLTPFAEAQHARWGVTAADVIAVRQAEETAASALLGTSWAPLAFSDAIYRGERYRDDAQLFGAPAADEAALPAAIAEQLAPLAAGAPTRFYVPLGVGGHVDHQLCFIAGQALARRGHAVWAYEDLPYALQPEATANRLARISDGAGGGTPSPELLVAVGETWERKLAAIFAYRSQVANIFRHVAPAGDEATIAMALAAGSSGGAGPRERFWRLP